MCGIGYVFLFKFEIIHLVLTPQELSYFVFALLSWCAPCKLLAPVMDQLAEAYDGTLKAGGVTLIWFVANFTLARSFVCTK